MSFMCTHLGVSRAGYCAWRNRGPSKRDRDDWALTSLIVAFHEASRGNAGVRRIHADLVASGHTIGVDRVRRLMHTAGVQGRHPKAWRTTTIPADDVTATKDLIGRSFTAQAPGQRWCGDVTYIKTMDGLGLQSHGHRLVLPQTHRVGHR